MKVEGPGRIQSTSTKKTEKKNKGGAVFSVGSDATAPVSSPSQTIPVQPLAGVDALLAVQAMDEDIASGGNPRSRNIDRADNLLGILEQVRMGLLTGRLPESRLAKLQEAIQRQKEALNEPELVALLDEIDLRAQVELAKFQSLR